MKNFNEESMKNFMRNFKILIADFNIFAYENSLIILRS